MAKERLKVTVRPDGKPREVRGRRVSAKLKRGKVVVIVEDAPPHPSAAKELDRGKT